ncbi:hypothetical protein EGM92_07770, partial [Enterobacter cloacae]
LSVLVALILTPALCATLLKPVSGDHHEKKGGFFGWFNALSPSRATHSALASARYAPGLPDQSVRSRSPLRFPVR